MERPTPLRRGAAEPEEPPPRPSPASGGGRTPAPRRMAGERFPFSLGSSALDVQLRSLDLGHGGQPLWALPNAGQQVATALVPDLTAEALADDVLAHLHLQPSQAKEGPLQRRPLLLPPAIGPFQQGEVRQLAAADIVHDQVAVALQQAHHRLHLRDRLSLLADANRQGPDQLDAAGAAPIAEPADEHLLEQPLEIGLQPWVGSG